MAARGRSKESVGERQAALAEAMLSEPDLYVAARKLGIGERTAARWWKTGFKERVQEARHAKHEDALATLKAQADEAARVMAQALAREAPELEDRIPERYPVACKVIDLALKLRESDYKREDLAIRRAELKLKERQAEAAERNAKTGEGLLEQLVGGGWVCGVPEGP